MIVGLPRCPINPPIRPKDASILTPQMRRPVDRPRRDQHAGPGRHGNAAERGRAHGVALGDWDGRIEAEDLVADGVEEGEGLESCGEVGGRGSH